MMDKKVLGYVKIGLMAVGIAVNVASNIIANKELDNKVTEKAFEAVAKMNKGDA